MTTGIDEQVGSRLRLRRELLDIEIGELAVLLEIRPQFLIDIERGYLRPPAALLCRICSHLGVRVVWCFRELDMPPRHSNGKQLTGGERDSSKHRLEEIHSPVRQSGPGIYSRSVDLRQPEPTRTKLDALIPHWKPKVSWTQFDVFVDRANELGDGRHVLFAYDGAAGCFRINDFGADVPQWATEMLAENRGRSVETSGDGRFGRHCSQAYQETLEIFQPRLEAVDATVDWPTFGPRRSMFWRATFPMIDPGKRLWLLSASLPDAGIDLRSHFVGD